GNALDREGRTRCAHTLPGKTAPRLQIFRPAAVAVARDRPGDPPLYVANQEAVVRPITSVEVAQPARPMVSECRNRLRLWRRSARSPGYRPAVLTCHRPQLPRPRSPARRRPDGHIA